MPIRYLDDLPKSAELVVIGGGVVGAATAFHAERAGLRPVIVEARPRLCTLTTPVAAGAFRLQFDDLEELELVRESAELFLNFEEITGQREYALPVAQHGYLWLTTDAATAARQRETVDRLHGWGQTDVEVLTGDETRERFPFVSPDVQQARFRQGDGFLDTKRLTFGLASGASADVVTSCEVTGFRLRGDRVEALKTTRGEIAVGAAVIATGPMSRGIAGLAGVELPLVTVRRQKLILPDVPEVPANAPMVIDEDTGAHWRPAYTRGAWLLHTDPTTPPSEPTMDVPTDHRFAFGLLDPASASSVARVVPFWREVWDRGSEHWLLQAGQYTITPDYRPLIGSTHVEGLFVNTGYSGHGIMLGPAGGRICAQALTGDLEAGANPFLPDRLMEEAAQPTL
jgi:sarcosine oxidase, subunit beta